jgi:hypothetical protein
MFCSGCGTEIGAGLNYCNRCGNRVAGDEKSAVAENLSSALGYIGGFGLLGFIAAIYLMMRSPIIAPGTIMIVSFLYLATLFGICFLILRQTAPFTVGRAPRRAGGDGGTGSPAYLSPATTAQLTEPNEPFISVTEHTTKTLDKVPRK